MKNIVIEIDGLRHKLVHTPFNLCQASCSLYELCQGQGFCAADFFDEYSVNAHFEIEK